MRLKLCKILIHALWVCLATPNLEAVMAAPSKFDALSERVKVAELFGSMTGRNLESRSAARQWPTVHERRSGDLPAITARDLASLSGYSIAPETHVLPVIWKQSSSLNINVQPAFDHPTSDTDRVPSTPATSISVASKLSPSSVRVPRSEEPASPASSAIASREGSPQQAAKLDSIKDRLEQALVDEPWLSGEELVSLLANEQNEHLPKEAANPIQTTSLVISVQENRVSFEPKVLRFPSVGHSVTVTIDSGSATKTDELALFVRHPERIRWTANQNKLIAKDRGETEIYVVHAGRMFILPAEVGSLSHSVAGGYLEIPEELVSLVGTRVTLSPQASELQSMVDEEERAISRNALSVNSRQLDSTLQREMSTQRSPMVSRPMVATEYKELVIQLADDRSSGVRQELFPATTARLHIVGTEFLAESDSQGRVAVRDVPEGARFLARVDDQAGLLRPTIKELHLSHDASSADRTILLMRAEAFSVLERMAGTVQHMDYGSICATVYGEDERPVQNVQVALDVAADGPYYYNQFGFFDRNMAGTGSNGRFCFINVEPGPVSVSLFEGGDFWSLHPVGVFAGHHHEEEFDLLDGVNLDLQLVAISSAHEQLSSDQQIVNRLRPVEVIDVIPLGLDQPMMLKDAGLLSSDQIVPHNHRSFVISNASEFEDTLYAVNGSRNNNVLPLIPRGFVEDLSLYAQINHDPQQGVVLVEHGRVDGQGDSLVEIVLLDAFGQSAGEGWYFADEPVTKAIFFNVPPGLYSLVVKTGEGYWLAADTTVVYNETLTYVSTGSPLTVQRRAAPSK